MLAAPLAALAALVAAADEPAAPPSFVPHAVAGSRVLAPDAKGGLHPLAETTYGKADNGDTIREAFEAVAADGTKHVQRVVTRTTTVNNQTVTEYDTEHVLVRGGKEEVNRGVGWNGGDKTDVEFLATAMAGPDRCISVANHNGGPSLFGMNPGKIVLWEEGKQGKTLAEGLTLSSARLLVPPAGDPIVFGRINTEIVQLVGGQKVPVLDDTMWDWSVARDGKGRLYVFAFDLANRSLVMATRNGDGFATTVIDTAEAGWQHSVAVEGDRVYVLYYYWRNTFNKGLKLAALEDGKVVLNKTFHRERDVNVGWEPLLGIASNGAVEVRYLSDVKAETKAEKRFPTSKELALATQPDLSGTWDATYKNLTLFAGAAPGWKFWHVYAPAPDPAEAPAQVHPVYDYDPSLLTSFSLEAKYGSWSFGASYARSLLDRAAEQTGETGEKLFQAFSGQLGIDDLLLSHDVKITAASGRFQGTYYDETGSRASDTGLDTVEVGLLNPWRMRYGLQLRRYFLTQPVYFFHAPAGETAYDFAGVRILDTEVNRAEVFIGYSNLDYLSKYENHHFGLDLDGTVGAGIGLVRFPAVKVEGKTVGASAQPAFGATGKLGVLWYSRSYDAWGAGLFLRAGWEAAALANGLPPGKPGDRPSETEADQKALGKASLVPQAVHLQVMHGPYVGGGVVY